MSPIPSLYGSLGNGPGVGSRGVFPRIYYLDNGWPSISFPEALEERRQQPIGMDMGERSRPFNDCTRFGLTNFSDLTNKLCLLRFLCLYLFLWSELFSLLESFSLSVPFSLPWDLSSFTLYHYGASFETRRRSKLVRIFILNPAPRGKVQGLPALSKNANGYMGAHTRMGDPQSLFAIVRDLQALPILGFFFPPFLPDLGIAMKFIVLLL